MTDVEDGSMITQMWNKEMAQLVLILVGSHTYTSKSLWWSSVRMVAQNLMQLLVSLNNVGKDSQKFANATSRPIARYGTRKHTCKKIMWGCATKGEPKCGSYKDALVAQL